MDQNERPHWLVSALATLMELLVSEVQPKDHAGEEDAIAAAIRGAPAWITPQVVTDTLRVFRPLYKKPLTPTDAVEMILNVGNLSEVLSSIDSRANLASPPSTSASSVARLSQPR